MTSHPMPRRILQVAFFAVYLVVGLRVCRDYGMSRDEPISRHNGRVAARYVAEALAPAAAATDPAWRDVPPLEQWVDRDYGVLFDLPAYYVERLLGLTDARDIYFLRHLLTFLLFYVSVLIWFLLVTSHFASWRMGLLGALLLIASPRVFAESFYNSKDIPFLSAYILGMYGLTRFIERKTAANGFLLGLATAVAIGIRMAGVVVPVLAAMLLAADILMRKPERRDVKPLVLGFAAFVLSAIVLTVAFYPYLWHSPFSRFIEVLRNMGKFRWTGTVLYFGRFIKGTELPWHYIPVWMLITIPPVYILFFLLGLILLCRNAVKPGMRGATARSDRLFLAFLAVPLFGVILFKSVLYDGWRQMYFIYAPFLLIALAGIRYAAALRRSERRAERCFSFAMMAALGASLVVTGYGMVRNHPHQNVYFNSLVPPDTVELAFDRDYWGLSYREGLEHVAKADSRNSISVAFNYHTDSLLLLSPEDRRRLHPADLSDADYFLSEYRWHPDEYPRQHQVYSVYAYGVKILTVVQLK